MKTLSRWGVYRFGGGFAAAIGILLAGPSFAQEFKVTSRAANERVWSKQIPLVLPNGKAVQRTHSITEIATGLLYLEGNEWIETREVFELFQDGVIARRGPHKVILAPSINAPVVMDLVSPDGQRYQSRILGIGLYDTGKSELIAEVKESIGQLHAPNQVVYVDAFDGLRADVVYTYRKDAFIQNVELRQRIVLPEGFRRETTRLEIWTEFLANPPVVKASRVKAGMEDEAISFGSMRMGEGKAFAQERAAGVPSIPVAKQWLTLEGRSFLVEAVRFDVADAELNRLGVAQAIPRKPAGARMAAVGPRVRPFPKGPAQAAQGMRRKIELASAARPGTGLTIDYDLQSSYGSLVLQAETTYLLSGNVSVTNLIIEGGSVLKRSGGAIQVAWGGTIETRTDPYRIAIFTSKDDDTAGESVPSSTGSPSAPSFGTPYIHLLESSALSHVRFSYGNPAIYFDIGSGDHRITHAQFVHCPTAIWIDDYSTFYLGNVLMHHSDTAVYGVDYGGSAEHLTVNDCGTLFFDANASAPVALTNSLLVNVTNWGNASITTNTTVKVTGTNVLSTVGGGSFYLANGSPYRDLGTTNINADLRADLRKMTTFPPVVMEPSSFYTNNLDLTPQAQRDTDTLDLGAHMAPLDFVMGGLALTNATLTASNGVAIGLWSRNGYGIALFGGAQFKSFGSAENPNWIVRYNTVQEQSTTNWASSAAAEPLVTTTWLATALASPLSSRFTHWSVLAKDAYHFAAYGQDVTSAHHFRDSQFHGGRILSIRPSLTFTNCLFERVGIEIDDNWGEVDISPIFRNCTIEGGAHYLSHYGGGTWTFENNILTSTYLTQDGDITARFNGYITNATVLTPSTGASNVLYASSSVGYERGTLGRFYLPTNSVFLGKGSTNAQYLGLYHFTTLPTNVKETNSIVDLGYHYVAMDSGGVPLDYDTDGIPDYLEDCNGNGDGADDPTSWQTYNSPNGLSGAAALQVFTPLK